MMDAFFAPLKELKSFEQLQKHIEKGNGVVLATGCIDSQKAQLVGALQRPECAQLVITADEQKARQMLEECRFYMPQAVYFPARDILFYQSDVRGNALTEIVCLRIRHCGSRKHRSLLQPLMPLWSV